MRVTSFTISILALISVSFLPADASKVTVDPNASKPPPSIHKSSLKNPDQQLAQKITYTATGKRLHTVLEELSKQTELDIRAGKSPADWQVRDLPVAVCVKDMPLGQLLRYIADSLHLAFTSTTVEDTTYYRIWRDPQREKQIADFYANETDKAIAQANAQWDAWVKLGEMSESELSAAAKSDPDMTPESLAAMGAFGKVIAALPAGTKEDVMKGRNVRFETKTASPQLADALRTFCKLQADFERKLYEQAAVENPESADDIATCLAELAGRNSESAHIQICCLRDEVCDAPCGFNFDVGESNFIDSVSAYSAEELLSGADEPEAESTKLETKYSPNLRKLDLDTAEGTGLDKKFTMPKLKADQKPSFADILSAAAEASGFSIVCEDFCSHRTLDNGGQYHVAVGEKIPTGQDAVKPYFGHETTLAQLLKQLDEIECIRTDESDLVEWHVDPAGKLLVGSVTEWWTDHRDLAPESLVSSLVKKIDTQGIELDDLAPALLLTYGQFQQWIISHKALAPEFIELPLSADCNLAFWKLYAGLSAADKKLAKSSTGLPLARLSHEAVLAAFESLRSYRENDLEWKGEVFEQMQMHDEAFRDRVQNWQDANDEPSPPRVDPASVDFDESEPEYDQIAEAFPEFKAAIQAPTDPEAILKLRMVVRKYAAIWHNVDNPRTGEEESIPWRYKYLICLEGDGVNVQIGGMDVDFPIYSAKRDIQLSEEARKKAKAAEK